ncbi:MAG: Fe-S protein assembly co-chaperone HscB [Acidobacteriota bacterium]|nr:Fe-S protein assembly co-chaperone HscB [Acidobacteriota bacterium]
MTYFEVFSLPRKLSIDVAALEKQFYALSRRWHPDRFAARPQAEQEAALAQASLLNDAYRTLRDPVLRTQYLLRLLGVELEEQSKAATEAARASGTEKKQSVPPELLEEVFELNMQLAEMRAARQMGEDEPELRRDLLSAKDAFESKLDATDEELQQLWRVWDAAEDEGAQPAQTSARDAMVTLLNKRTYLRNLVRDVNEALESESGTQHHEI